MMTEAEGENKLYDSRTLCYNLKLGIRLQWFQVKSEAVPEGMISCIQSLERQSSTIVGISSGRGVQKKRLTMDMMKMDPTLISGELHNGFEIDMF